MTEKKLVSNRLEDKVVVITGGASGIGLASARRVALEGAKVVIADLDETRGAQIAEELGGFFIKTNVTSEEDVKNLFKTTVDTYGRVDVAFNNAGISPDDDNSILSTGIDAWRRVQEVNLTSVYYCCKYALEHMVKQGSGSIINTASFVALMGAATSQISYSASKGAVLSMSRELGVQFAKDGIRLMPCALARLILRCYANFSQKIPWRQLVALCMFLEAPLASPKKLLLRLLF